MRRFRPGVLVLLAACHPSASGSGAAPAPARPESPVTRVVPPGGLGAWTGHDDVAPSARPPGGLAPAQVPQLVAIGFDDNGVSGLPGSKTSGGVSWVTGQLYGTRKNPDGSPVHASFYLTSQYATPEANADGAAYTLRAWQDAFAAGHELGDHTHTHPHGNQFSVGEWQGEMQKCLDLVAGRVLPRAQIVGFRTPYLEYNDHTFSAAAALGFRYDCSIEDGSDADQDGASFHWPYTLDRGSPGSDVVKAHPGLWEMPAHPVIVPPDEACARYGVPPGLRARMKAAQEYFDVATGKITGADWNLWIEFGMTRAEFVATLKYTLDLRRRGNRAPMMLVGHADIYSDREDEPTHATLEERQAALAEFLDYALAQPEVRVVSVRDVLDYVRNPAPL
jgi:hypothetical protein